MALNQLGDALRDVVDLVCAASNSERRQPSEREECHSATA